MACWRIVAYAEHSSSRPGALLTIRNVITPGLLLALATVSGSATNSHALEIFGRCLIGPCQSEAERDSIVFIDPVRYTVTTDVSGDDDLRSAILAASALHAGRGDPVGGNAGLISRAQADYSRILAALYNQGHYGGSVSIRINGREASDIAVGSSLEPSPSVSIAVDTGPTYRFGRRDIDADPGEAAYAKAGIDTPTKAGFADNADAEAQIVKRTARLTVEAWRHQGHGLARITQTDAVARHEDRRLDVRLGIDPGPQTPYGQTNVSGTERMDPQFVARQAALPQGTSYDPDDLDSARRRIERLGVFSVVRIDQDEALDENGQLPLTVNVTETKPRRIGAGVTYSSFDGFGAESFWLHRNLFGKAERLRIDGKVGGIGTTTDVNALTYAGSLEFWKPGIVSPDTDVNARIHAERRATDTAIENVGGARAGFLHQATDATTLSAHGFVEYGQFEDLNGTNPRQFLTVGTEFAATIDTRDNKLDASSGYLLSATVTPFHELRFGNAGLRADLEARHYIKLDNDGDFVFASRFRAGSVVGPTANQTPDNFLFTAGGGGSVRGYGFGAINVVDATGRKRGGLSRLEASAELRAKVTERIGAVTFVDAGSVSDDALFGDADTWRIGVGAGIRYDTGLGPLRLDVGIPLDRQPGERSFGIYAGIGQAF